MSTRKITPGKKPPDKKVKDENWLLLSNMIVVWHMKMVLQWVFQKFPDGECAPALFQPYIC